MRGREREGEVRGQREILDPKDPWTLGAVACAWYSVSNTGLGLRFALPCLAMMGVGV